MITYGCVSDPKLWRKVSQLLLEKILYYSTSLSMTQFIQNHLKSIFWILIFTIVSELTKLAAKFLLIFEIILLPGISYISLHSTSDQPILRNVNKLTNFSLLDFMGKLPMWRKNVVKLPVWKPQEPFQNLKIKLETCEN